jgi:guanine deaminase
MQVAINEAFKGMRKGEGGPFGAVVVRKGKIIATAHNLVLKTHDPTSHAEITAIRKASKKLKKFDLSDCEIYSTCEPCPMCLAAIEWARIKILYYGCTREDADKLGFGDKEIYADLKLAPHTKLVNSIAICDEELQAPFKEWMKKPNKKMY